MMREDCWCFKEDVWDFSVIYFGEGMLLLELEENENGESGNRTGSGGADPVHEWGYRGGELV